MITLRPPCIETVMPLISAWRHDLNCLAPCVITGVSFFGDRIETQTVGGPPDPDDTRGIWLDLTGGGRHITAANLAAALGQNSVRFAAADLVGIAAGQASQDVRPLCSCISSVAFAEVDRYPLDRPDLRRPSEGGPS